MSKSKVIHKKEYEHFNYIHDPAKPVQDKGNKSCRIMTYNVHGFRDLNDKNKYSEIIATIKAINPDILILEEIRLYPFADLCTKSQLRSDLIKLELYFSGFSECGINGVFSRFPFTAKEIDLGRDSIRHVSRNALVCTFTKNDILSDNLIVVGTHLDVFDESGKQRISQIKKIMNMLSDELTDEVNTKIIVAGDFNSLRKNDYTEKEWKYLTELDKKRKIITIQDVAPIIENAGFIESSSQCQTPIKMSVWAGRRVDYIFGKNVNFIQTSTYTVTYSDHYPVYADI